MTTSQAPVCRCIHIVVSKTLFLVESISTGTRDKHLSPPSRRTNPTPTVPVTPDTLLTSTMTRGHTTKPLPATTHHTINLKNYMQLASTSSTRLKSPSATPQLQHPEAHKSNTTTPLPTTTTPSKKHIKLGTSIPTRTREMAVMQLAGSGERDGIRTTPKPPITLTDPMQNISTE